MKQLAGSGVEEGIREARIVATPSPATGLIFAVLLAVPALAQESPPVLDVQQTCRSAGRVEASGANAESCLRDENTARDTLKKAWATYGQAAKTQCTKQFEAGGFPSYVELQTCLELASGSTAPLPAGSKTDADLPKRERPIGEPLPNQRTNPIDVLNDK